MYNLKNYWGNRLDPNSHFADDSIFLGKNKNFIKSNITENSNILEIGPGIGRLVECYKNCKVTGLDITDKYKQRLIDNTKKYNIEYDFIINTSEILLPFKDNEFDYVISSLVLLHQPPQNINTILKEMKRVGRKVIVISSVGEFLNKSSHCFNHNYKKICEEESLVYVEHDNEQYENHTTGYTYITIE